MTSPDGWWHERPTKAADLQTRFQALPIGRANRDPVWNKAALVVGLMFAFIFSLISMVAR